MSDLAMEHEVLDRVGVPRKDRHGLDLTVLGRLEMLADGREMVPFRENERRWFQALDRAAGYYRRACKEILAYVQYDDKADAVSKIELAAAQALAAADHELEIVGYGLVPTDETPETIARWVEAGLPPWGCHFCRGAEYGPDGVACPACHGRSDEVEDPPAVARIRAALASHGDEALRAVALALVFGQVDGAVGDKVPQRVWDALYADDRLELGSRYPGGDPENFLAGGGLVELGAFIVAHARVEPGS